VELCDGLDNDCDASVDNNLVPPLNPLQLAVCAGSVQTCTGAGGWIVDYSSITEYEVIETLCDGLDNDCDGLGDNHCGDVYEWIWMSGSSETNQAGVYGTQGVTDPSNIPGARSDAVSWSDSDGNLWLFGGTGIDSSFLSGRLNDLWRFDGTNWTWVSGSNTVNQPGVYGTQGVVAPSNIPGARYGAVSWSDSDGSLWLFGGSVYVPPTVKMNDLWMKPADSDFDGIPDIEDTDNDNDGFLNAADCAPLNASVFPGQTAYFTTPRPDNGTFDYDCSGSDEQQYADIGSCATPPPACTDPQNGFVPGWEAAVPVCGVSGNLITTCTDEGDYCNEDSTPTIQACR
jgi:hypothetical protein